MQNPAILSTIRYQKLTFPCMIVNTCMCVNMSIISVFKLFIIKNINVVVFLFYWSQHGTVNGA